MAKNKRLNPKIVEFQKRDLPINYSNLSVDEFGKLQTRVSKKDYKDSLDKRIVKGYGVIWGSVNDYGERFVKGSFAKSISEHGPDSDNAYKIKFRDEHGRVCALMAKLEEDEIGLYFETKPLDDVSWANDMLVQLKSESINNFSIGFKHCWDRVEWDDEEDCMINLEARLFEISGVAIPSDLKTFAVRSSENEDDLKEDIEEFIETLPRSKQLEARKIFTRSMSLVTEKPNKHRRSSPDSNKPPKKGIDYNFLTKKLKQDD